MILKFRIDTLEHFTSKYLSLNLMANLRSQYLSTGITIQPSNGSCMLNSFAVNEFLYMLYVNHSPCLYLPRPSSKLSYLYGLCPSPDIPHYHLRIFPVFPAFSFSHQYITMIINMIYVYSGPV
jgi:hypothetical protein